MKELDPGAIRARANAAVRTALHAMCAGGPVILVVEDIHWIDLTSRQLLGELARSVPDCPALLIATTRPGSSDRLDVEHERIALAPLDHADTRRAIETLWPPGLGNVAPELVDLVERVTGGVPFFIEEVCQWLAENETLETGRLPEGALAEQGLGAGERARCAAGISRARARSSRAAAAAGNRFSPELLERLLPEFDRPEIAEALDALTEAGFIVRSRPSDPPLYGFRHALIQETIYADTLRKHRQDLHRRLYASASSDRHLAGWLTTAALAEHAERGGLLEQAICAFVGAGVESSSRSAIPEASALLEHAIDLCRQVAEPGRRDELQLSAMVALGPILTAAEGPNSTYARKLYEEGVEIARRRPSTERAKWFPIYWGWWFTGSIVDGERAQAVVNDLRDVDDPEVRLQAKHCLWAVEFNRGSHDGCIAAVDAALPLYDAGQGNANATRFGGHDARVCALAHRALSEWFIGRAASALRSMAEARAWARQTGHVSSITHACINEAMLHCYRRDFAALRGVIADLRELTERHQLPSSRFRRRSSKAGATAMPAALTRARPRCARASACTARCRRRKMNRSIAPCSRNSWRGRARSRRHTSCFARPWNRRKPAAAAIGWPNCTGEPHCCCFKLARIQVSQRQRSSAVLPPLPRSRPCRSSSAPMRRSMRHVSRQSCCGFTSTAYDRPRPRWSPARP